MQVARFYFAYLTLGLFLWSLRLGGAWTWLPVGFVFGVLPLLDALTRPERAGLPERPRRWIFDVPLLAWPAAQLAATTLALGALTSGAHAPGEAAGIILSLGLMSGSVGINVAHELMHRAGRLERGLAELLMTLVGYPHFCIEHVSGHHKRVATPDDPATARLGENVFAFFGRTLRGGLRSAWRLEAQRVARLGLAPGSWGDRRARLALLLIGTVAGVGWAFGVAGVAFFALQAAVAIGLLESINYLEHYGLERRELAPGRYERVGPQHAWSSPHRISNWYLFNLARHADHHVTASRPYEQLSHLGSSPELPAGYAAMLLLAWCPPLWHRVMDPRARRWRPDASGSAHRT